MTIKDHSITSWEDQQKDLALKFDGIIFTKREIECMKWLIRGKTIKGIARILLISPRTVEYYLKTVKIKVGCRTKYQLVDLLHKHNLMELFDGARLGRGI